MSITEPISDKLFNDIMSEILDSQLELKVLSPEHQFLGFVKVESVSQLIQRGDLIPKEVKERVSSTDFGYTMRYYSFPPSSGQIYIKENTSSGKENESEIEIHPWIEIGYYIELLKQECEKLRNRD